MSKNLSGEKKLAQLVNKMDPILNRGVYVFTTLKDTSLIKRSQTLFEFKEVESTTVVLKKEKADALKLPYEYVASWITLNINSSLDAVGFTAIISSALAKENISANVVAGYFHDHIFVPVTKADKAMKILHSLGTKN